MPSFRNGKAVGIVSMLMVVFGLAEVVTGFRHEFFGLTTTGSAMSTIVGATLGLCYFFAGTCLAVHKKRSVLAAFVLLIIDVAGRVAMVVTGMYPMTGARQSFGIIAGTLVATAFATFAFREHSRL